MITKVENGNTELEETQKTNKNSRPNLQEG
jgi:hypothetical protein